MTGRLRFVCSLLLMVVVCAQAGRAYDYEGGRLSERVGVGGVEGSSVKPDGIRNGVTGQEVGLAASSRSESLYQGKPARWWARRAVQARKDANARGRTIRRLQSAQKRDAAHFFAWLQAADCIHQHEAGWEHNGPTYDGGMQADLSFQRAYGSAYLARWGPAYLWPWWAQLHMAYNGWVARGWQPWPTRRYCGL